eukprot:gb/GFBE01060844.1/.p1 GENE.gb/GFBE01060844.1/~~gb/GFBE01060844.1/.p1  ORF type:complete len:131 (+),score=11.12 gb/GFBE01060844.1/:1-393(+)
MARPCPPSASRERKLRFGHLGLLIAACCAVVLSVQLTIPGPAHGTADAGQATRVSTQGMAASLEKAMAEIQSMETPQNKTRRPPSRGSIATSVSEAVPHVPQDPVLAAMMNGPPLFSPALCARACHALMG